MKKIVMLCFLVIVLFLLGCQSSKMENPPGFCTQDSDCRPTGCSNTVCGNLFGDPEFTICEYKYEYSCYKNKEIASCGCVDYKCQWAFVQPGFDACTEEQSKLNDGVPIV